MKAFNEAYNHSRPLSEFEDQLDIIRKAGFKPIAVTQMMFEDTFVFETKEEANEAYYKLEQDKNEIWIGEVIGWWYGREDFADSIKEYEKEGDSIKVRVYWL